jgi:hypothetical protein
MHCLNTGCGEEVSVLFSFSLVSVSFAFLSQKKEKEMEKVTPISYLNHL